MSSVSVRIRAVAKRKIAAPTERCVQRSILRMMGIAFPKVRAWHVPNGAYLGDNPASRKRTMGVLLGDGLKPGAPDLACYWAGGGHQLIEVKRPGYSPSKVSPEQIALHAELAEMGHPVAIVTSAAEAFALLKDRGAPTNLEAWREAA